ncbi:hypothetical protein [Povalibacter sp.]|uniref:hypothetical protein n=1 Tax=Povalibacter sp. TaxID=1962978 RepID=UPI002F3EBC38
MSIEHGRIQSRGQLQPELHAELTQYFKHLAELDRRFAVLKVADKAVRKAAYFVLAKAVSLAYGPHQGTDLLCVANEYASPGHGISPENSRPAIFTWTMTGYQ